MARHIAIVEDEASLRANLVESLTRQSYRVTAYADRATANAAFAMAMPDLVVIDIGLGDEPEGGFELCRELRSKAPGLPILILSARDSDPDIISGLRLGADDYLSKDVSLAQLSARIAALLRRTEALAGAANTQTRVEHGELRIEVERMAAFWRDQPVPLTVTEFWIVHALARRPGHVRSRARLLDDAAIVVDEQTVTSHVKRIRRKFEAIDAGFDGLETIHGAGYRWRG